MKIEDATFHGFRFSFRDWAGSVTNFPREITETALAHVIDGESPSLLIGVRARRRSAR